MTHDHRRRIDPAARVLLSILVTPALLPVAQEIIAGSSFYTTPHREIWSTMLDLAELEMPIDHVVAWERLAAKFPADTHAYAMTIACLGEEAEATTDPEELTALCHQVANIRRALDARRAV